MAFAGSLQTNQQEIIDELVEMRVELVRVEIENEFLRKKLAEGKDLERAKLEKLRAKAQAVVRDLKNRYDGLINKLRTTVHELEGKCENLQHIAFNRKEEVEQICRLQDELEIVRSRLASQENEHRKNKEEGTKIHEKEIRKYQNIIADLRAKLILADNAMKGRVNIIPENSQTNELKLKRNSKRVFIPKWPNLNIQKTSNCSKIMVDQSSETINQNTNSNTLRTEESQSVINITTTEKPSQLMITKSKKRKLFSEDRDAVIDV